MQRMRQLGYLTDRAEQDLFFPERNKLTGQPTGMMMRQKKDLFGFADWVAVRANEPGTVYGQSTTVAHQADRLAKILNSPVAPVVLQAGNRILVHGWVKRQRNKIAFWDMTEQEVLWRNGQMMVERRTT